MPGMTQIYSPERAQAERALFSADTVVGLRHIVSVNQVLKTEHETTMITFLQNRTYISRQPSPLRRLQNLPQRIHKPRIRLHQQPPFHQ